MRLNPRKRGYSKVWERTALEFRRRNPLCLGCAAMGRTEPATLVDHIIPHRSNSHLFWSRKNWQPSCDWHHNSIKPILEKWYVWGQISQSDLLLSSKKAVELSREKYRPAIGVDGFAVAGS